MRLVIDASVAAKWALPARAEPLSEEAFDLLSRYTNGEIQLVVPDLFWAELANVFWKAARLKRVTASAAKGALQAIVEYNFPTIASRETLELAFALATAFDRSVYDSLYVAVAISTKSQLVTADEKLANAMAARFPVKWLGAANLY
jgi:predicted nucleic acid-binding protein